jgi:hypothetical protein
MEKQQFRVLHGSHREGSKTYRAGDVVESFRDLSQVFANKFLKLSEDGAPVTEVLNQPLPKDPVTLKAVHKGKSRWDVINIATGKRINSDYLTRDEARTMASGVVVEKKEEKPKRTRRRTKK